MAVPTFVAVGTRASALGSTNVSWPAGHQADDIGLLLIHTANQAVPATPSGWAEVANSPQGAGTAGAAGSCRLTLYWKRATSAAEADVATGDSGDHNVAVIAVFRGCETAGDPVDTSAGDALASASTTVTVPGGTTTADECLVVAAAVHAIDAVNTDRFAGWANADLANVTEVVDTAAGTGVGGGFGVATGEKATAGLFGATTATLDMASLQGRIMVALKPPQITEPPAISGAGSPSASLSKSASGTGSEKFSGSGTPAKPLGASASGAGTEKFSGSGAPAKSLGASAGGAGTEKFSGSGSPAAALAASASGSGTNTPDDTEPPAVSGTGSATATLGGSGAGAGSETFTGAGAGATTLGAAGGGAGSELFSGSGSGAGALGVTAAGTGTNTPDGVEPPAISGSGAPTVALTATASGSGRTRRGRGGFRRILLPKEEPEPPKTKRRRKAETPEAAPLPEPPAAPARIRVQSRETPPPIRRPTRQTVAVVDYDEDEELLIHLLALVLD